MKNTAYGKPILINDSSNIPLERIEVSNELQIQDLIFDNPECLPISDIDESYNPIIPVCKELNTPSGPLDILFITPNGQITIVETKLWRNPEARRVVIAQTLDYAQEVSKWRYDDLQREVNRKLQRKGNTLYKLVQEREPNLLIPEAEFVDSVSRNLDKGKFLLLIAGDGIREGAIGIAEFLSNSGHLNFTFAMVELNLYHGKGIGTLVIPKTIAKTVEIPKLIVDIPAGFSLTKSDDIDETIEPNPNISPEKEKEKQFYIEFWREFVNKINFDDPGQPLPNPAKAQNLFLYPSTSRHVWISAYFAKSSSEIGVYFRTQNSQEGHSIKRYLAENEDEIKNELGEKVSWWNWSDFADCGVKINCQDIFAPKNQETIKNFFHTNLNLYVNVFRPYLKAFIS